MSRIVLVTVVTLTGCGGKKPSEMREAVAKMEGFSNAMCECRDKACADKVNEDMTKWGTEMAKNAGNSRSEPPDPELAKKAADVMTKYTECMTKLMMMPAPEEVRPVSPDSKAAPEWKVPPVPKSPTVDTLLKAARESAVAQHKALALASIDARYVRSDGSLDAKYGILDVAFGEPSEKDDPNRPIGAPVPEPKQRLTDCPSWTFTKGEWSSTTASCKPTLAPPRCNLAQIWKRAIQEEAPAAALATIAISSDGDKQSWTFTIVDEPRKIRIEKTYPDDCEPIVERTR